jgi:serine/threonine-protein kinase
VRYPNVDGLRDRSTERRIRCNLDGTLEQELAERGPFGARDVAAIGLDVCRALTAVHDAGLLHRDIKAQNVIREPGGRVVLMDFGTGRDPARSAPGDGGAAAVGTPLYGAPELFSGAPCSVPTEIYSVGVLLFHLATGGYPVAGHSVAEIREAHGRRARNLEPEAQRRLPRRLSRVLARALAVDPNDRYRDVRQLARALERVAPDLQRFRRAAGWLDRRRRDGSIFGRVDTARPVVRRRRPAVHPAR